jgi:hypothetical protein
LKKNPFPQYYNIFIVALNVSKISFNDLRETTRDRSNMSTIKQEDNFLKILKKKCNQNQTSNKNSKFWVLAPFLPLKKIIQFEIHESSKRLKGVKSVFSIFVCEAFSYI